jgi:hypothetical protein
LVLQVSSSHPSDEGDNWARTILGPGAFEWIPAGTNRKKPAFSTEILLSKHWLLPKLSCHEFAISQMRSLNQAPRNEKNVRGQHWIISASPLELGNQKPNDRCLFARVLRRGLQFSIGPPVGGQERCLQNDNVGNEYGQLIPATKL